MSREWPGGGPLVTLLKHLTTGSITWNPHFTDPSMGELATTCILNNLGEKLKVRVRYSWNDVYGNHYSTYRIRIEKRTAAGGWQVIPGGVDEPTSSEFGNPAGHSVGHHDKLYEIVADDSKITWRLTAQVKTGEAGAFEPGEGSPGSWDNVKETREFQLEVRKCSCNRCRC